MKVRDLVRLIERDGWYWVRSKGSHHQYKHATKPGLVTVPGKPGEDMAVGTLNNILKQAEFSKGPHAIDTALLENGPERDLYDEVQHLAGLPIEIISRVRSKVDLFFDKVMVNVPDQDLRHSRLSMLSDMLRKFSTIADFSEIVTSGDQK